MLDQIGEIVSFGHTCKGVKSGSYLQPDQQVVDFVGLVCEASQLSHHGQEEVGIEYKVDKRDAERDGDQNEGLAPHMALLSV